MKIAVVSASLGGVKEPIKHLNQLVKADYFTFTDENFPPRKTMAPRLQAKIPKMFGWQLKPDYDAYLWLDDNMRLSHHETTQYFLDAIEDHDIAVLKHPFRDSIHWEYRYTWRGVNQRQNSNYMVERYEREFLDEQYEAIKDQYPDDLLVIGGAFMYRNTPQVQQMMKEWWYHVSRYQVNDQIPFPYVLKQSGVKYNVLPDNFDDCMWLERL